MTLRGALELILFKSLADLKAEASRSYLGILWWVIEPILYLGAFYLLFEVVMKRGDADFAATFLTGAVVWKWFDGGTKWGAMSIWTHLALIQQVRVPKFVFPAIAVTGTTLRFGVVFLLLAAFLVLHGCRPGAAWAYLPLLLAVQFLLVLSAGTLAAAVTPFVPDVKPMIDNGLLLMFFLSGVMYDVHAVPEPLRGYLMLNPMAALIDGYRAVLVRGQAPDLGGIGIAAIEAGSILACGLAALRHLDRRFGKVRFG